MTQTAVEWFAYQLGITKGTMIEQAKEMEKQQTIDAHIEGQRVFDTQPHSQWTNDQAEIYYISTYGSKGSDETNGNNSEKVPNVVEDAFNQELFNYFSQEFEINLLGTEMHDIIDIVKRNTSSQTEISDDEIEKAALEYYESAVGNLDREIGFRYACKWYREQLKQRQ